MDTRTALGREAPSDHPAPLPRPSSRLQPPQPDHQQPTSTASITLLPTLPESPTVAAVPSLGAPSARTSPRTRRSDASTSSLVASVGSAGSAASAPSSAKAAPTAAVSPPTVRAVTPDLRDQPSTVAQDSTGTGDLYPGSTTPTTRPLGTLSPHRSPRTSSSSLFQYGSSSSRRRGIVFSDDVADTFDAVPTPASPPLQTPVSRPRIRTMDGTPSFRESLAPSTMSEQRSRTRVSSVSSTNTSDSSTRPASTMTIKGPSLESLGYHLFAPNRSSEVQGATTPPATMVQGSFLTASSSTASMSSLGGIGSTPFPTISPSVAGEKNGPASRLIKRTSSRPTSPLISLTPSVDSVPSPIPTDDANRVLMLMKNLGGRMRGEVEYRALADASWSHGVFYVEKEKGSLMFDAGEHGQNHTTLVADLRGCRVFSGEQPDIDGQFLELVNAEATVELVFRPLNPNEVELWLAALISWQQVRPMPGAAVTPSSRMLGSRTGGGVTPSRLSRQTSSGSKTKESAIIKVGKVMLWDKGTALSPDDIVPHPTAHRIRSAQASWRRVSCILRGSGEVKLMTESDAVILSTIELAQLARCAVQQLDKSVLDEEYCIALFPIYAPTATRLSLFRPLFIALDSRVAFEVWFVLLRAFTVPNIYFLPPSNGDPDCAITDTEDAEDPSELGESPVAQQFFRVEKSLNLRVTEATIKRNTPTDDSQSAPQRPGKTEQRGPLIGNYLAEVILDGEVRARTTTKPDTKNPFWREECDFVDLPPSLPYLSIILKNVEGNLDSITHQLQASLGLPKTGDLREVMVGSVDIQLDSLERGKDHEQWLPIHDDQKCTVGSMFVKVHHEELAVLAADEYKPLLDMLHRFGSSLTLQIAEVMPGRLRRLADVFLDIFQVSGTADKWIMAMIEDEIDGIGNQTTMKKMRFSRRLRSAESIEASTDRELIVRDMGKSLQGEANLLFRGNSLLTQALEFHMRRLGKEYLEEVLSDKIFEINEINPDCEVDPSKAPPGQDLSKHWDQLMALMTEVWECIISSASRFPPELRHILKYIRAVAEDRYGDFLRTVAFTSVSGFLFLRFVCPAILNPKLFGLLRDHPRPRAQRTLTLIAKSMQALANLSTIGKKETWMEPMNRFLAANRQSLKDFIDAVCSIPAEKPHAAPAVPASYSTPLTVMGRLPQTAREGFPSLPYLIDQPRSVAALIKLWVNAHPLSAPPHMYDGDLLEFNNACLAIQARADDCLARTAELRRPTDAKEPKVATVQETLADAMEEATLTDTVNMSYGNTPSWMESGEVSKSSGGSGDGRGGSGSGSGGVSGGSGGSAGLVPPGSSGSEMDDPGSREGKPRQLSFGNRLGANDGSGSIKILRTRKFFSGIINRKARPSSPEHAGAANAAATTRGNDRDKEGLVQIPEQGQEPEREREREKARERFHNHKRAGSKGKSARRDASTKPEEPEPTKSGKIKKDRDGKHTSPGKTGRVAESKTKT